MKNLLYLLLSAAFLLFIECKEPCDEIDCGPHGTCVFGDCDCDCDPRYSGPVCETYHELSTDCSRRQDSISLVKLYDSTMGDQWALESDSFWNRLELEIQPVNNYRSAWLTSTPISEWH